MRGLFNREVRILIRKELRQLTRSRSAVASSVLLPILLLLILPMVQLFTATHVHLTGSAGPPSGIRAFPPGLVSSQPGEVYATLTLPIFVALGGIMVPSVTVIHSILTERDRKSLELLIALPVRVRDILVAKVSSVLIVAAVLVLPLFAIDSAVILAAGVASLSLMLLLLVLLLCALACSAGIALVVTLVARDFRGASNWNGAMFGPLLVVTVGVLVLVPSPLNLLVLGAVLLLIGGAAGLAGVRWLTFERYLR